MILLYETDDVVDIFVLCVISSSFLACCALLLLDIAAADSEVTTIVDA